MPTRTISNTGGNYNATGSWVEGVVPTSADDIVATATSGQLTVNVSAAARTIDLSNYANTITMNANWTVSGAGLTNSISSVGMTWSAGSGGVLIFTSTQNLIQNGTRRIPHLRLSTLAKSINSDLYCVNFDTGATTNQALNGTGSIFCSGFVGNDSSITNYAPLATTSIGGVSGTAKLVADGVSGFTWILLSIGSSLLITGSYSTPYDKYLALVNGGSVSITGTVSNFNIILSPQNLVNDVVTIDTNKKVTNIILNNYAANSSNPNYTVNIPQGLTVDNIITSSPGRTYTSDNSNKNFIFSGGSLSASNVSLSPFVRTNSSSTAPTLTYIAPDLRLDPGFTHSFGNITAIGGLSGLIPGGRNARIQSSVAGSQARINLLSKTASQIAYYSFTDINAVGEQIISINGTFSNVTNVTATYPTGGSGSAGGSYTFVN